MFRKSLMMNLTMTVAALVLVAVAVPAAPAAAQKFTMKIGTPTPRGNQNEWMARFKKAVDARTGGEIAIKLYPASQLGSIPRSIEGVQLGTIEAWVGPPGFVKGVDSRYQVMDAPGLFQDMSHAQRAATHPDFRDHFLRLGENKGIRGISIYVSSTLAVLTRGDPIRRIGDFKGLKIRVLASEMEVEAMRTLGAAPTPIPLMEVLPALQRGAVDGVRTAVVIFVPFKYWTISKYLTETDVAIIPVVAFVSTRWFKTLPQRLRTIILEEGRKLDQPMHKYSLNERRILRNVWVKNGGELIKLPAADQKTLIAKMAKVGPAVVAKNPEIKETYGRLLKAVAATRK